MLPKSSPEHTLLRLLWQGHTLTVWWEEWPKVESCLKKGRMVQASHPQWIGVLRNMAGRDVQKVYDSALLERLKRDACIDRQPKKPQDWKQEAAWTISDKGRKAIGIPTQEELKKLEVVRHA